LDGDGALDVVIGNREGRVQLLRNVVGQEGQWAALRLLDGGRDALGATASIEVDGKPQRRSVKPGYSYCSSSDPAVHFGLGAQTAPLEVEVRWPDGELETFGPVPLGARSSLVRGQGR
ncbi:MAG: ASPIC/UnbV domain-containing protein, partial [Planctomycetota bacterium]|nr:ASPIC/UnbV domain-containing protein [Planctomycetota bacterium]